MKKLTLDDLPLDVLESVYKKWEQIETIDMIDWNPCSICEHLKKIKKESGLELSICSDLCPLHKSGDCKSYPILSKLHIRYWNHLPLFSNSAFTCWKNHRLDFLKRIKEVIDKKKVEEIQSYDKNVIYVKCSKCGSKFNESKLDYIVQIKVDDKDRDVLTFFCSQCSVFVESFRYSME